MEELRAITEKRFNKIMADLDMVGAKKVTRDTVRRNLDEFMVEVENYFAANAEGRTNKLVINRLQDLLNSYKEMTEEKGEAI